MAGPTVVQGSTPRGPSQDLHDAFDGTGNVSWTHLAANGTVAGGALTMPTTSSYPIVESLTPIDLQGQSATARLAATPNTAAASTQAFFQIYQPGIPQNYLGWMWTANNTLTAELSVAGTISTPGSVTYAANTQWLRIAENAGTVSWQTSTDGTTWTTHATTPVSSIPFPITTMTYKLGTGHWRPESSPGNAVWDDVTITGDYDAAGPTVVQGSTPRGPSQDLHEPSTAPAMCRGHTLQPTAPWQAAH